MKFFPNKIFITIIFLLFSGNLFANKWITTGLSGQDVGLGQGYSAHNNSFLGYSKCVKFNAQREEEKYLGGKKFHHGFSVNTSDTGVDSDTFGLGASLSFNLSAFEFSSYFNLYKSMVKTEFESRISFLSEMDMGNLAIKNPEFIKVNDAECGDYFVSQIKKSTRFISNFDIDFFTQKDRYEFEFKIKSLLEILGHKVTLIDLYKKEFFESLKSASSIKINLYQFGGDISKFENFLNEFIKNSKIDGRDTLLPCAHGDESNSQGNFAFICLQFSASDITNKDKFEKIWSPLLQEIYKYGDFEFPENSNFENAFIDQVSLTEYSRLGKNKFPLKLTASMVHHQHFKSQFQELLKKNLKQKALLEKLTGEGTDTNSKRWGKFQIKYFQETLYLINKLVFKLQESLKECSDRYDSCETKLKEFQSINQEVSLDDYKRMPYSFTYFCKQNFYPSLDQASLYHIIVAMIGVAARNGGTDIDTCYRAITEENPENNQKPKCNSEVLCPLLQNFYEDNLGLFDTEMFTHKNIYSLEPFLTFSNLHNLSLEGNQISSLEGIRYLQDLRKLNLKNNLIKNGQEKDLGNLTNLNDLNLSFNLIEDFDFNLIFNKIPALRKAGSLKIENNLVCRKSGVNF